MGKVTRCTTILLLLALTMPSLALSGSSEGPQARGPILPSNDLARLQVNVTLANGVPAPGQTVILENLNKPMGQLANVTDSSGRTNIMVSSLNWGPTKVYCDATSTYGQLGMREVFIGPNDIVYLDLVLAPMPPSVNLITGKVLNWSSKMGVPNNPLRVRGTDPVGRLYNIDIMTDGTGSYSVLVPNSTSLYSLAPGNIYTNLAGDPVNLFLEPGVNRYELDIPMKAIGLKMVPLELRFTDLTDGSPITYGMVIYGGLVSEWQHANINFGQLGEDLDGSGKVVSTAPKGEYEVTWIDDLGRNNLTMLCRQPLVVNDTLTRAEIKVPIPPTLRHIKVWTKSGGNIVDRVSIQGSHVYSIGLSSTDFRINGLTNSSGCMEFKTLPDRETILTISKTGFSTLKYTIPPGPVSSPLDLTIDLGEKEEGNLSVVVRDKLTNAIVPFCNVKVYDADSRTTSKDCDMEGRANFTFRPMKLRSITATANLGTASIPDVVITEGEVTEVTILLDRNQMPLHTAYGYFYVKDQSGSPIPALHVYITPKLAGYGGFRAVSTNDGKVRFYSPLGDHQISQPGTINLGTFRSVWIYSSISISHSYAGQRHPTVIAYPSEPLVPFTGTVRDLETGKPLDHATITFYSNAASNFGYNMVFFQQVRSMDNGLYRTWGRDLIMFQTTRPGYFMNSSQVDLSKFDGGKLDIYLRPIPPSTVWVNGTLVNESDQPIAGQILPDDMDWQGDLTGVYVNETGRFGLHLYPGRFSIYFVNSNSTISDTMTLEVGTSDISGLVLKLVAHYTIYGKVTDALGTPMVGVNVTMECTDGFKAGSSQYDLTDSYGQYYLNAYKGSYEIAIDWTETYDRFESGTFSFSGKVSMELNIVLMNRTHSDINGRVIGMGGPSDTGIPGAVVGLLDRSGTLVGEALTDGSGNFSMDKVPFGTGYHLEAAPPEGMAFKDWKTSGYRSAVSYPFDLNSNSFSTYIVLPYVDLEDLEFLEVKNVNPMGNDVPTEMVVQVRFNIPVNRSSLEGSFSIAPEVGNVSFHWFQDGTEVTIGHDPFAKDTEYTVVLGEGLRAETGAPLREGTMNWTFMTGDLTNLWELTDADIVVGTDRSVNISASGLSGIWVYVVIDLVGSFSMSEAGIGSYRRTIPSSMLEWNTSYTYHFSDVPNGSDKAPSLSGTFRTPIEPVVWRLDSASVRLDEGGDWVIEAHGLPGMDVWFVVDGIGSFQLEEIAPGNYRVDIPDGRFKQGKEYDYWFSDQEDGEDLAPALSGSQEAKSEAFELRDGLPLFCCLVIVLVTVLALIALVLFLVNRRKGTDEDEEWGEE